LDQARSALAKLWAGRIARLLESDPDAAAGVRELITVVNASGGSVAAGRDPDDQRAGRHRGGAD